MLFLANDPKIFTVGSIINNASELPIDTPLTFFLFRVQIGRAHCHRVVHGGEKWPSACPEGFDSIYLQHDTNENNSIYSHKYVIYNAERVTLIHQVVTKIKVEPLKIHYSI